MKHLLICLLAGITVSASAQTTLPVTQYDAPGDKPFILMVSGDGGLKGFTVSLAGEIHAKGYVVGLVDARSYFWKKKTPEETTAAIVGFMEKQLKGNTRKWIMLGYSFGADITPFVVNRLPDSVKNRLTRTILLSPSTSTDFEIHVADMLGIGRKRSLDVIQEINRMGTHEVVMLGGDDETDFPFEKIHLTNFSHELIRGNHHFDGDYKTVAEKICDAVGK